MGQVTPLASTSVKSGVSEVLHLWPGGTFSPVNNKVMPTAGPIDSQQQKTATSPLAGHTRAQKPPSYPLE